MDIKIIKSEKKSSLLKTWENTHNFWIWNAFYNAYDL